jgi:hypothetical protein
LPPAAVGWAAIRGKTRASQRVQSPIGPARAICTPFPAAIITSPPAADESPEEASNDTSAGEGPDFANSSRFHSAPFQRRQ